MATTDVSDAFKAFVDEFTTALAAINLPVYVYRSDLIFEDFPCVAIGFTGYSQEQHYFSDQMQGRAKGMYVQFDIGIVAKSKDENEYSWNDMSGLEALVAIVEEIRTIIRQIRFRREYFEIMTTSFDAGIIYDPSSQLFEFTTIISLGILRTD